MTSPATQIGLAPFVAGAEFAAKQAAGRAHDVRTQLDRMRTWQPFRRARLNRELAALEPPVGLVIGVDEWHAIGPRPPIPPGQDWIQVEQDLARSAGRPNSYPTPTETPTATPTESWHA